MQTAIVTGGAKGIGRAIVEELATKGINVILNYKNSEQQAMQVKEELCKNGCNIEIYKADVSKREEVQKLVQFAKQTYGNIDILINNAGIDIYNLFTDITDEEWNSVMANNLNSVFYMTQEVIKDMIHNKKGCIINISSIWGITGASCEVAYSVSKAGIDGLTKALAKEVAPSGIRVNSVAPGAIMTDMNKDITEQEIEELNNQIPLGKFGKPEDIAKCVSWLVEDQYTTGQIISPNGGWVI
jgi:3-oxoacyl-[acyl-carrier protein] reductase